jgi:hypothetical protein
VAIAASWAASSAQAASGVQLYVGYADGVRPNPVNFPTPWDGSPGVIFEGCHATATQKCEFDSSAVRLVNNTSTAVTVDSLVVEFPGAAKGGADCTFDIWPHNISVPAGGQEIEAQQSSTDVEGGCHPNSGWIDGSDIGPNGANWGEHCTQSGVIPQVVATIDGTTETIADSGQVLDTGGVDSAYCPTRQHNESEQWVPIGMPICTAGATLTLAPPTQTHFVGTTATVTGTLDNGCGQPLQGATENFDVLSGPDAGLTGSGVTDVNGQADFTYTGVAVGTDVLDSTVMNPAGTITSNDVDVKWVSTPLTGGTFVIGDLNDAVGTPVTFWGAKWWKLNSLSGGRAPAAFKGFALHISGPTCGDTWTSTPGNSPPPPPGPLPPSMPIIVSSHITKSGRTISGDIEHIVIVDTNPRYEPNPGHAGTGTVVNQVC